jgi:catechol 2,3-dioxygenase-like lactoylglutathione lyase family enzyme
MGFEQMFYMIGQPAVEFRWIRQGPQASTSTERRYVRKLAASSDGIDMQSDQLDADTVNVRYMVDDVAAAVEFYTAHLGFTVLTQFPPFADVKRGNLRLLLSGPASSAGRAMPDGRQPGPGGWNRIHLLVEDIDAEVARLRGAGVSFRSDVVSGPGGKQIVLDDPSGNPIELFQPAGR